jgi:hypothetical protein
VSSKSGLLEQSGAQIGFGKLSTRDFAPSSAEAHTNLHHLLFEVRLLEVEDDSIVESEPDEFGRPDLFAIDDATGVAEILIGPLRNFGLRRRRRQRPLSGTVASNSAMRGPLPDQSRPNAAFTSSGVTLSTATSNARNNSGGAATTFPSISFVAMRFASSPDPRVDWLRIPPR